MQSTVTLPGLREHFQELLQHPDFGFDVEVEVKQSATIYTFDTETSNFDLILESNSALLMQYDFVPSPDGLIEDFDVEFKHSHQIKSVEQFLNIINAPTIIK
ncbi:MAG: hypothetical protein AAGA80_05270 [Cyanobacteria bacterium P01_F01_bin.143]